MRGDNRETTERRQRYNRETIIGEIKGDSGEIKRLECKRRVKGRDTARKAQIA